MFAPSGRAESTDPVTGSKQTPVSCGTLSRERLERLGAAALAGILLKLPEKHGSIFGDIQWFVAEAEQAGPTASQLSGGGAAAHADGADTSAQAGTTQSGDLAEDTYMVGGSPEMLAVYEAIRRCARCDAPVLIGGESGTGKELAALAIHERSDVHEGPFVPVNCGGLPSELIASEMFGHEKGSFTGAVSQRIGRIEQAHNGTLFLDEIGDLPLELQAHLLRFLQDGVIQRVGSNTPIQIRARVVAATNVDLEAAVAAGRFRHDLFYRLDVLRLRMPALRHRSSDIPLLARYFLDRLGREMDLGPRYLSDEAMAALTSYHWHGNVRELVSALRRAIVMADDSVIGPDQFEFFTANPQPGAEPADSEADSPPKGEGATLRHAKSDAEATAVRTALRDASGNVTRASRRLGVSRVTFYKLMRKHGINRSGDDGPLDAEASS